MIAYVEVADKDGKFVACVESFSIAFLASVAADCMGWCEPWDLIHDVLDRTGSFVSKHKGFTATFRLSEGV
jgi:hypothetical protein